MTIGNPMTPAASNHLRPRPANTMTAAEIRNASCEARVTVRRSAKDIKARQVKRSDAGRRGGGEKGRKGEGEKGRKGEGEKGRWGELESPADCSSRFSWLPPPVSRLPSPVF